MANKLGISMQIKFPFKIARENLQTTLEKLQNTNTNLELKLNIDKVSKNINSFNKMLNGSKNTVKETSKLSNESYKNIQRRINEIRDSVDKYAKLIINTSKQTGKITTAVIEYKNETGKVVKETMGWHDAIQKVNGEIQKIKVFGTKNFQFTDNIEKTENAEKRLVKQNNNLADSLYKMKLQADSSVAIINKFGKSNQHVKAQRLANSIKQIDIANEDTIRSAKKLTAELKELERATKATGKGSLTLSEMFKQGMKAFSVWQVITEVFYRAKNAVAEGIQSIIQLNSKVVELEKVTDETENTYKRFVKQSYEVSNALARTGSAVVATSASFARMGFNIQKSMALAKDALMLTNIGDGISEQDSTKTLIATLKGFGMEANNSRKIIDSLNEVSNNYAVTISDLSKGITRTSATMAQSNTSFDETLAIITSAVEVLQNAEIASSGIITISQRLRSLSEEGKSLGKEFTANLQNAFKTIANVDIMDSNGLRSTYDILSDTAKVWKTLTQEQQQYLAELSAGNKYFALNVQKCA